jgi:NAD(P) transhydrogenase
MERYDLIVLGSGPSGQKTAVQAAKLGKRVAVIEKREVVGGVCINTGTIPSKALREAVLYLTGYGQHGVYGASYSVKQHIGVDDLKVRVNHVIRREIDITLAQLRRNGVDVYYGEASLAGPNEVAVAVPAFQDALACDFLVIAVGTRPAARSPHLRRGGRDRLPEPCVHLH